MNEKTKSVREAFRAILSPIIKTNPKGRPIDQHGRVYLDPTPVAPPVGYVRHKPMHETIREMVRSEALRQAAENAGLETFEDADDFRIGDDFDPMSPYEYNFDPPAELPADNPPPVPPVAPAEAQGSDNRSDPAPAASDAK